MGKKFTATHHALLFAWISKAVIEAVGERTGEPIMRRAVIRYAMQRGRRMALRAEANGHELTMDNYMAYSEWKAPKEEMEQKLVQKSPNAAMHVFKCPWHTAWKENNLMAYGRYFCMEVDKALVKGFNKDLRIDVNSTQPNDGTHCDFVFYDAQLKGKKMAVLIYKKLIRPGKNAVMSWEYHCGHLYKTIGEVLIEELGERALSMLDKAMEDFSDRYGDDSVKMVKSYMDTNFNQLPS
ncbi:L-2-amino-thiazoline-4-carboxylic acid hydrolase [Maledivibacter halophilus]|uniref:L-2-amino-thiazoline-4-carboxylic acid hydrolase n=1 Tax=Maledivibacter halophilus TaxID=36842 RepID=A0A1T5LLJ7_9FIRM|nr:L-2-amino-thiazoline-4-carboxylic acid hydrolase [Maledivibacter halophilus]SKC76685.1 L-2-amino-thiazoline-4-carboxylic acid hydrolase [Maledivibacter halophilus]